MNADVIPSTTQEQEMAEKVMKAFENIQLQTQVNDLMVSRLLELEQDVKKHQTQLESLESHGQGFRDELRVLISTGGLGRQNSVYLGENLALTRVLGGFKMIVETTDLSSACHLITDGFWEMGVTHFIRSVLHKRMRFADIGARFGYFSLVAAEAVGPRGQVYGLETDPRNFNLLIKNVEMNGFSSKRGGPVRLHQVASFDFKTLRDVLPELVDVIRIETAGNELDILEGLQGHLNGNPETKILLAVDPQTILLASEGRNDFLLRLKDLGYSAKRIAAGGKLEAIRAAADQLQMAGAVTLLLERR